MNFIVAWWIKTKNTHIIFQYQAFNWIWKIEYLYTKNNFNTSRTSLMKSTWLSNFIIYSFTSLTRARYAGFKSKDHRVIAFTFSVLTYLSSMTLVIGIKIVSMFFECYIHSVHWVYQKRCPWIVSSPAIFTVIFIVWFNLMLIDGVMKCQRRYFINYNSCVFLICKIYYF